MRPPEFWDHKHGRQSAPVLRALLTPLGVLYAWGGATKQRNAKPERVTAPVICVGNLTLGGVGKTPVVRAIRSMLAAQGIETHVLLRGYGGTEKGPLRIDATKHSAEAVGDEALLHAIDGPTWIAADRAAGARAAIAGGAQAILLDDGFQNPSLAKDLSILVFDAETGLGNGAIFPAGPLREPAKQGLARADLVVLVHKIAGDRTQPDWLDWSGPIVHAALAPKSAPPSGPLIAFAGIGRPLKFFDGLKAAGGAVIDGIAFADHHTFAAHEIADLKRLAQSHAARLITTEKDFVRLPPALRQDVAPFPIEARFADDAPLRDALLRVATKR